MHNLDWKDYVIVQKNLLRKHDSKTRRADVSKIKDDLGWKANNNIEDVLKIYYIKNYFDHE